MVAAECLRDADGNDGDLVKMLAGDRYGWGGDAERMFVKGRES